DPLEEERVRAAAVGPGEGGAAAVDGEGGDEEAEAQERRAPAHRVPLVLIERQVQHEQAGDAQEERRVEPQRRELGEEVAHGAPPSTAMRCAIVAGWMKSSAMRGHTPSATMARPSDHSGAHSTPPASRR